MQYGSLKELREDIDRVDYEILQLIAKRKDIVAKAAFFKSSVEEIKSDDRISDVISKARHNALALGVSPELVSKIYKDMIEDMVETEIAQFRNVSNF
jgi:isochorismate pyruvate lyase